MARKKLLIKPLMRPTDECILEIPKSIYLAVDSKNDWITPKRK